MGYVPDGMTEAQWKKMKEQEQAEKSKKNFGAFGPQTFKSRSLMSFQKDLEEGKAAHLLPVFNSKEKIKKGEIKQEDIPYMQRLGAWDNSDVKTAKKKQWRSEDNDYEASSRPFWAGTDWSGANPRQGPNRQAPKQNQPEKPKVKKLFGLF